MKNLSLLVLLLVSAGCANRDGIHKIVVSVPDQKMVLLAKETPVAEYLVSTSKFGVGSGRGSYATPLGKLEVAKKIGDGAELGTVFKSRNATKEILPPNAPGRDPIVSRILWLKGNEPQNANAYDRLIYIHGTPEERRIGRPASYGCIRMRSRDVAALFEQVGPGTQVEIQNRPMAELLPATELAYLRNPEEPLRQSGRPTGPSRQLAR